LNEDPGDGNEEGHEMLMNRRKFLTFGGGDPALEGAW
jgi:hypothetical protein